MTKIVLLVCALIVLALVLRSLLAVFFPPKDLEDAGAREELKVALREIQLWSRRSGRMPSAWVAELAADQVTYCECEKCLPIL